MFIGCLQVELLIPDSASLKEKRMVLKSIKQRLQNKFNISVAEIDHQNLWQRASLGIAMVSNENGHVSRAMDKILKFIVKHDANYHTPVDVNYRGSTFIDGKKWGGKDENKLEIYLYRKKSLLHLHLQVYKTFKKSL